MARTITPKEQTPTVQEQAATETDKQEVQIVSTDMVIIQLLQEQNAILVEVLKALQPLTTEVPKPQSN